MSSQQINLLNLLKKELLVFFDELISILPEEKDFLVMRFFIKDQIPITEIMKYIIEKLVPLESFVKNRDDKFFLEHQVLFEDLKEHDSKVNYFKHMWQNPTQHQEENKEIIWKWFDHFIRLAKRYDSLSN